MQSNTQGPAVWGQNYDGAEGLDYTWKLANAVLLVEAAFARGVLSFHLALEYRRDETEGCQGDSGAPASSSSPRMIHKELKSEE